MDQVIIKDVSSFCRQGQHIKGQKTWLINELDSADGYKDSRLNDPGVSINFEFSGKINQEGRYVLFGHWDAQVGVICSYTLEPFVLQLSQQYPELRVLQDDESSLDIDEEGIECISDKLDLGDWLLSEVLLTVPMAPKNPELSLNEL